MRAENIAVKADADRMARELEAFRTRDGEMKGELAALRKANEEQSAQFHLELASAQQRFRLQAQAEQKTYQRSLRDALFRVFLSTFPAKRSYPVRTSPRIFTRLCRMF